MESTADQSRPEGVGLGEVDPEIEDAELLRGRSRRERFVETDMSEQNHRRRHRATDVDHELHDFDPDDGFDAAGQGEQSHHDAQRDHRAGHTEMADQRREDIGGEQQPHAVRDGAHDHEERGRKRLHRRRETRLQKLVDRDQLAAKIPGHEESGDEDARHYIAEDQLQKPEVPAAGPGDAGDGDEGDGGRLGGHDRRSDRPPGNLMRCQEVLPGRVLPPREEKPRADDGRQVDHDDGDVERMQDSILS